MLLNTTGLCHQHSTTQSLGYRFKAMIFADSSTIVPSCLQPIVEVEGTLSHGHAPSILVPWKQCHWPYHESEQIQAILSGNDERSGKQSFATMNHAIYLRFGWPTVINKMQHRRDIGSCGVARSIIAGFHPADRVRIPARAPGYNSQIDLNITYRYYIEQPYHNGYGYAFKNAV